MSKQHAMLSASGASRWLTCTPSARLEQTVEETESSYADEGTLAHAIAEILIRCKLFSINPNLMLERLKKDWDNDHEEGSRFDDFYSEEMWDCVDEYSNYIVAQFAEAPAGAKIMQEAKLNLHDYVPEGYGSTDVIILADYVMDVFDYKHGKGVPVDAFNNKQMMMYALGAYLEYNLLYDIQKIRMTIYQPRIGNISTHTISVRDLMRWANEIVKPTALMAFQGVGDFVPGDHCRFCRIRSTCTTNAQYNLQVAKREFDVDQMTDEQLVKVYERSDSIKNWLNSIDDYMLKQALGGKKFPGLKLVAGRSVRKYTDQEKILDGLTTKGGYGGEQLVNKKILGITAIQKIVSKLHFKEFVEPYLVKPPGAPTLVSEDDQRPEFDRNQSAKNDFIEEG